MRSERYTIAYHSEVIALLSRCFDMTPGESGTLLADAVKNGGCLLCFDGGKLASAALHKDVSVKFGGENRRGVYIFGLCTAPEYRGAGLASGLVDEICAESGADYALLIPENDGLFEFYEKLGFEPDGIAAAFRVSAAKTVPVYIADNARDAYAAYRNAAEKCGDICMLSESDLASSAAISPQTCVIGKSGICFVGGDVEVFAPDGRAEELAASALELCGVSEARAICPLSCAPEGAKPLRIGMIRSLCGETQPGNFYINNLFNR